MRRLLSSLFLTIILAGVGWLVWDRVQNMATKVPEINNSEVTPAVLQPPDSIATAPLPNFLAPDFLLRSRLGGDVRLSDSLGKATVVTFWQGQCVFCLSQLQTLTTLARNYPEDIMVLAINRADDNSDIDHVWQVLQPPSNFVLLLDPDDIEFGRYAGNSMPLTFFVDKRGVVIERLEVEATAEEIEKLFDKVR